MMKSGMSDSRCHAFGPSKPKVDAASSSCCQSSEALSSPAVVIIVQLSLNGHFWNIRDACGANSCMLGTWENDAALRLDTACERQQHAPR
jgi:hypothetical protein